MLLAIQEARKFIGATAPNPPVGACLVKDGKILSTAGHKRAGGDHAEIRAIKQAIEKFGFQSVRGSTLYVTLEPCNHTGKTPPCTGAIIECGIERVVFGISDPNPSVEGGGAQKLRQAGLIVEEDLLAMECFELIAGFSKWAQAKKPWVVQKLAYRINEDYRLSLIPEKNMKTFTTEQSLLVAHEERKKADAILTGMGTIRIDQPFFTVRKVPDHPGKKRILAVLTKRDPSLSSVLSWKERQASLGFEVVAYRDIEEALENLGQRGIQRVLVEAGPTVSTQILRQNLWDERLIFLHLNSDFDMVHRQCSQESLKNLAKFIN